MLQSIWTNAADAFAHNQVMSGGAVLMVVGAIAAYMRNLPSRLWTMLRRQVVLELHISQKDQAFQWLVKWLAAHTYTRDRAMSFSVSSIDDDGNFHRQDDPPIVAGSQPRSRRPRVLLSPSKGEHFLFHRGCLMWISRSTEEAGSEYSQKIELLSLFILTRNRHLATEIVEEARDHAWPPEDDRVSLYRLDYNNWSRFAQRQPRPATSVILREGLIESLIDDVRSFSESREWYVERGIPYRRGYLLYGPPGTGKSSAVIAIASELKMEIAVLNLAGAAVNDDSLLLALATSPDNSIVLIEDIDCVFNSQRESTDDKHGSLTFSGLLNAIDGVSAGDGRILFATTNHIERIDSALIRPGRFDRRELVDYPTHSQASRLFQRFFPEASESLATDFATRMLARGKVSAAEIQSHLITHSESTDGAIDSLTVLEQTEQTQGTDS